MLYFSKTSIFSEECEDHQNLNQNIELILEDGQMVSVSSSGILGSGFKKEKSTDSLKKYAHLTLEICMVYVYLHRLIQYPERKRLLAACKMTLILMKASGNCDVYPMEILRLLVQQYSLLPLREAFQSLEACFVKLKDRDEMIPADMQMQNVSKQAKKICSQNNAISRHRTNNFLI